MEYVFILDQLYKHITAQIDEADGNASLAGIWS